MQTFTRGRRGAGLLRKHVPKSGRGAKKGQFYENIITQWPPKTDKLPLLSKIILNVGWFILDIAWIQL